MDRPTRTPGPTGATAVGPDPSTRATGVPALADVAAAVARVHELRAARRAGAPRARVVVALVGEPGSGKSTLAAAVAAGLEDSGTRTVVVPMDGFHLAGAALARLGRLDRKGALDTFDAAGYVALLRRLVDPVATQPDAEPVWAPEYVRDGVEESLAGAIEVGPDVECVVTEGLWLLVDEGPWRTVRDLVDETWAVRLDDDERRRRLVTRHVAAGKGPEAAEAWVQGPDEAAARLVRPTLARADRELTGP